MARFRGKRPNFNKDGVSSSGQTRMNVRLVDGATVIASKNDGVFGPPEGPYDITVPLTPTQATQFAQATAGKGQTQAVNADGTAGDWTDVAATGTLEAATPGAPTEQLLTNA